MAETKEYIECVASLDLRDGRGHVISGMKERKKELR
jgi:hypothetical protein